MPDEVPAPYTDLYDRLQGRQTMWRLEEVPGPAMAAWLRGWLAEVFEDHQDLYGRLLRQRRTAPRPSRTLTVQALAPNAEDLYSVVDHALQLMQSEQELTWTFGGFTPERSTLTTAMLDHGSAFQIGEGNVLEWRVPREIVEAYEGARRAAEEFGVPAASSRLASAWHLAYSREPNPGQSMYDSIRAVEAVAIPVVIPRQTDPQLWQVYGSLRSQPERWRFALVGKDEEDSIEPLVALLGRLAGAQTDRHEGPTAVPVLLEAARAAVHAAASLVQWFASGAVERRPKL